MPPINQNRVIGETGDQPIAMISCLAPAYIKRKLTIKGYAILEIPENEFIYREVCTHPDLFLHLCHGRRSKMFVAQELIQLLGSDMDLIRQRLAYLGMELCVLDRLLTKVYPGNVLLNGVEMGKFLLANPRTLSSEIMKAHEQEGRKLIEVKQGYTKCSVVIVSDNALITEDEGIALASVAEGVDVLQLQKGFVHLEGFDYGFIGGSTGALLERELMFAGDLNLHPQGDEILRFCKHHHVAVVSGEGPLLDVGSILIL